MAVAGSEDERMEADLEALFEDAENDAAAGEAAATAVDPATGSTALDSATAAPTVRDPETMATAMDTEDQADEDLELNLEDELFKEVEAALFSGSEDEGEAVGASQIRGAIERLAPKGGAFDESPAKPAKQAQTAATSSASSPTADGVPPPPPPPPAAVNAAADGFDESRYMRDQNGELLHKWKVDYALRAGGGRAMCKDTDCLERHEQGGVKFIEKGALRIGRRVLMKGHGGSDEGTVQMMWYHARCMFNVFLRSRKTTRVIQSAADLEGFEHIVPEDQEMLRRFIHSNEEVRAWKGGQVLRPGAGGAGGKRSLDTPEKTSSGTGRGSGGVGLLGETKRRRVDDSRVSLRKGDRVWTFCRVRPAPSADGRPPAEFAVKSPKPELGLIVEEEKDGHVIVQFEKLEDEKERVAMYMHPKKKRIRAWLRYPRIFEGKKQRLPVTWIQFNRPPPKLCGCVRQEWAHGCECSGISCGRGTSTKIWGVGQ